MKRFLITLVCIIIAGALGSYMGRGAGEQAAKNAYAESLPLFYIEAPESAGVGDTIKVRVGVSGDFTASILSLRFYYDESALEYVGHTRAYVLDSVVMSGMSVCEHSEDKHMIAVGIMITGDEGFGAQGDIFEAEFKVLSAKTAQLTLEVPEFDYMPIGESIGTPISFNIENAAVNVSGSGSGAVVTAEPVHTPTVPQPSLTAEAGADTTPIATSAANETASPTGDDTPVVPGSDSTEPSADVTAQAGETSSPSGGEDKSGSSAEEIVPAAGLSDTAKVLMIAGACVLAGVLAWLTVFFFKRGRAAGREAKKDGGDKDQK